jgi:hypothetical protein
MQATESVRGAGDEATTVAGMLAPGRKGEGTRGLHGQSAAMQTVYKFELCLRRRGQAAENASGRWARFFPARSKSDHPLSVCVGPLKIP